MSFAKISFEESSENNVVATGKCVGCGTCVAIYSNACHTNVMHNYAKAKGVV